MSLDWRLFCELRRLSASPVWQVESHPNIPKLAAKIRTSANTVWRRLKEWRRLGFLGPPVFLPNPRLFGLGFEFSQLVVSDPAARNELLDRLELVDGVVQASIDYGNVVSLVTVADSPTSRARRLKLLGDLPGVSRAETLFPLWLPTPTRSLRTSDVQLIDELRRSPEAPITQLGKALGVSGSTISRRFHRLRSTGAMLTYRIEDFSRFPSTVAVLELAVAHAIESRRAAEEIAKEFPDLLELTAMSRPPFASHKFLDFLAEVENVSQIAELEARLAKVASVTTVSNRLPGGERVYEGWILNRMHELLSAHQQVLDNQRS
ncbi:MAG TPA: AsnC family transcriptional regulator [Thermoplasmata archaeon]|nr:AsnC family transcriptional regulator [Thermoplasmata archaeon]